MGMKYPTTADIFAEVDDFIGSNGTSLEFLEIVSEYSLKHTQVAISCLFNHKNFGSLPPSTQMAIANLFARYPECIEYICRYGTKKQLQLIGKGITLEAIRTLNIDNVPENLVSILVKNPHADNELLLEIANSLAFEDEMLTFLKSVPEDKLSSVALAALHKMVTSATIEKEIMRRLRNIIEQNSEIPEGLPDEWLLKLTIYEEKI